MRLASYFATCCLGLAILAFDVVGGFAQHAQQGNNQALGNVGFFGGGPIAGGPVGGVMAPGGAGGAANADFDSLIDLIQSTVEYDSWMENGTGEGEIQPFPTGVYADAQGALRFDNSVGATPALRRTPDLSAARGEVRRPSPMRYVSLPRLEQTIAVYQSQGKRLPEEMLTLAGLQRVEYVFLNADTRDLILAGPAGDWWVTESGILVSTDTGRPVLRLDDLLTLWRRASDSPFGCSITPRQQALADTQKYLAHWAAKPLQPSQRKQWLTGLRDSLGKQDVEFFAMVPESHVAMILLVADYHMKLIGMGLADGVPGVTSYLDTVELSPDGSAPPMSVLRWWFAMSDRVIQASAGRDVFRLPAGGVKVLSENELLAARGERVHTNQSDALNRRFAKSFTDQFTNIVEKYPLYGELENIFDLALVLALVDRENLLDRSGWQPTLFEDVAQLRLPQVAVPQQVETVINHRVIGRRQIIAGISGGVWVDARSQLRLSDKLQVDIPRPQSAPLANRWWWD